MLKLNEKIKFVKPHDECLKGIVKLYHEVYQGGYSYKEFHTIEGIHFLIKNKSMFWKVAINNYGEVVGCIKSKFYQESNTCEISSLVVRREYRNLGIAQSLISEVSNQQFSKESQYEWGIHRGKKTIHIVNKNGGFITGYYVGKHKVINNVPEIHTMMIHNLDLHSKRDDLIDLKKYISSIYAYSQAKKINEEFKPTSIIGNYTGEEINKIYFNGNYKSNSISITGTNIQSKEIFIDSLMGNNKFKKFDYIELILKSNDFSIVQLLITKGFYPLVFLPKWDRSDVYSNDCIVFQKSILLEKIVKIVSTIDSISQIQGLLKNIYRIDIDDNFIFLIKELIKIKEIINC